MKRICGVVLTAVLLCGWAGGQDPAVRAYLDRTSVFVGERFTLSVEVSGQGASGAVEPRLPPMEEFTAFLGRRSSQQYRLVNGRMSSSRTFSYQFQATREGEFEIGAVQVQLDGRVHKTAPLRIRIAGTGRPAPAPLDDRRPAGTAAQSDLFVRATADPERSYRNQALVVTYKIYTRVSVSSYGISKQPETAGFWVEDYPQTRQPQTDAEVIGGRRYTVALIKKMALFPTSAGEKEVGPLVLECRVRTRGGSRDPFRGFFSGDLFGREVTRQVASNSLRVQVLPLPQEGRPPEFQGAVGSFSIAGQLDKSKVKANEALTYKVRISGSGNLAGLSEPRISFPSSFEVYPPKVEQQIRRDPSGISGEKTYEYVLIPRRPGPVRLEPVKLAYFDPVEGAYRISRAPELSVQVAPGDHLAEAAEGGLSRQEVKLLGQDIRFIKIGSGSFRKTGESLLTAEGFWIPFSLPLLCLLGAVGYRRHLTRLKGDVAYARARRARRISRKRLARAQAHLDQGAEKEFYQAVGQALMGYLADKLNAAQAGMVSQEVKESLRVRGIPEESLTRYFDCLQICDLKQFAPSSSGREEMRNLMASAREALTRMQQELASRPEGGPS